QVGWCAVCRAYVRIGVLLKDKNFPVSWESALVQRLRQLSGEIQVSQVTESEAGSPEAPVEKAEDFKEKD
ncbi:unnamed protein product, partial [Effrenium voratum]